MAQCGELAEALNEYREAHRMLQSAALDRDAPAVFLWDLSVAKSRIGESSRAQGRASEALKELEESVALAELAVMRDPTNHSWADELGARYVQLGELHRMVSEWDAAARWFDKAIPIRERLAEFTPPQEDWFRRLAVAHYKAAEAHAHRGDPDREEAHLRRCHEQLVEMRRLGMSLDPQAMKVLKSLAARF